MIRALVAGVLLADPQLRQGPKAPYVTALLRSGFGDMAALCNLIAFGQTADALGGLRKGDSLSVAGRAEPCAWLKDGEAKASLSLTVEQIISLPSSKPAAPRRRRAPPPRPQSRLPAGDTRPFDDPLPW
jgi:single-stranded DNA-binding protein